ncbi:PcfJ domain-containing protein [Clostridium botulinum]|uniref:PcfJ domain-containing protein n=1 Tax=Clostridium botulinum TaxID=1491 RepID=UPI001747F4C0|nr:PcfJ domain-containing protein [Clostridium botulinum]MBD5631130.1 PcfJ domain-containing protein [Clostridium botulinum]MBD5645664.1 PcfJ domain-containing protein [Clostridium botulinum]
MRKAELKNVTIENIKRDLYIDNIECDIKYLISSKIIINSHKEKILILSFFLRESLEIKYRVFLNKQSREYATLCFEDNKQTKWSTGIIKNIISYRWIEESLLINTESINCILKYLNVNDTPLYHVYKFQHDLLNEKRIKRYSTELEYIDSYMKTVPKIPKTFYKWVDETALIDSRYIFYKYKRTTKAIKGYCSHCKQEVSITNPKHNKKGICPCCKSSIIFKSEGKVACLQDEAVCCLIQKANQSNLVIRYFEVLKTYGANYKEPTLSIFECLRDFNDGYSVKEFEYRNFVPTNENRWCKGIRSGLYAHQYDFWNIALYTRNLDKVLKNTKYQYSQLKSYATQKQGFKFPVYSYLYCSKKYPFIEYLWKLGLSNLIDFILYNSDYQVKNLFDLSGKNFMEILKLDKNYLSRSQKLNITGEELSILQSAYKNKIKITNEEFKFVSNIGYNYSGDFFAISKYSSIHKTIKYLEKQKTILDNPISNIIITWKDYLDKCIQLKYNLSNEFILFPKKLNSRHDEICLEFDKHNMEIYNKKIYERYKELSKLYNWKYKDYIILVASSANELIKEGQELHHCVGGTYKRKMANGETNILFLRKKDDPHRSFYTIEIKDNCIRQIRGFKDKDPTSEIEKVIEMFKKEKLNNKRIA